jgi:hypothetical protein
VFFLVAARRFSLLWFGVCEPAGAGRSCCSIGLVVVVRPAGSLPCAAARTGWRSGLGAEL